MSERIFDGIASLEFKVTDDVVADASAIIESAQEASHRYVNKLLVARNWLLGKRILDEELKGDGRAKYGKEVLKKLSTVLSEKYGKGFSQPALYQYVLFAKTFPEIFSTVSRKSPILSWSHYRRLLSVADPEARAWYEKEALSQGWSYRTLDRNIASQYYHRLLKSQAPAKVEEEMLELTQGYQTDRLEFIKNPVVAEFLGLDPKGSFTESDLESSIISSLQKFLMELGKGYAFVERQQHIRAGEQDFYIDLVFYNYILKCFVLIDLKTSEITHQDIGQMDMYVRMYDDLKRGEGDNPTLGIVLCSETNDAIMHYSVLSDKDQLFAAKYLTYLPTEEQLRAEIEAQKAMFNLEHATSSKNVEVEDE